MQYSRSHRVQRTSKKKLDTSDSTLPSLGAPIGNKATIQMMRSDMPIQRYMTVQQFTSLAGQPKADVGFIKRDTAYKTVLGALKTYNDTMSGAAITDADTNESLRTRHTVIRRPLKQAIDTFVAENGGSDKAAHMQTLLADTTRDGDLLATVSKFVTALNGTSFADTLTKLNDPGGLMQIMGIFKRNAGKTPKAEDKEQATQEFGTFLSSDEFKTTTSTQTASSGTQPFRGGDKVTKASNELTKKNGVEFHKSVISPLFVKMVTDINNSDGLVNTTDGDTQSPLTQESGALVASLYKQMVEGMLQVTGQKRIPDDIIDSAADLYRSVKKHVEGDENAEHPAEHAARVSVINMIFLRWLSPMISDLGALMSGHPKVKNVLMRLSMIFQSNANGLDMAKRYPEMVAAQKEGAPFMGLIDNVVNHVISQASLKNELEAIVEEAPQLQQEENPQWMRGVMGRNRRKAMIIHK